MILGSDGKRLSKRHEAASVGDYAAQGILPDAMLNFLVLLGWSPGADEQLISRMELVEKFSLDRVLKKSAVFDPTKLEWLNGQHLARVPAADLVDQVLLGLGASRKTAEERLKEDEDWFLGLIDLLKDRARTTRDISIQAKIFLDELVEREPEAVKRHWGGDPEAVRGLLAALNDRFSTVSWEEEELEATLRELAGERGIRAGKLIHPLRVALTGQGVSPGVFEVLFFLGRDLALGRIRDAISRLERMETPRA